jgi:molybdenum cofactor guanylyltransferase
MTVSESVIGVLLAGGKSSRMGGGDKCLRPLGGRPILAHIIERLKPQVCGMIVNANGQASRFAEFGLPVVADTITGLVGPLAGVHAGLEWVKANRPSVRYAVTVATDTPFFPTDLVARFLAGIARDSAQVARDLTRVARDSALIVARSDEGLHPVIGLWSVALAPRIEEALKGGVRKVGAWTKAQGAVEVFFPKVEIGGRLIDPFFNINEQEELDKAEALLNEQTP